MVLHRLMGLMQASAVRGGQVGEAPPSQVWTLRQVLELWVVLRVFRGRLSALGARAWALQRGARQSVVAKELVRVHPMCELVLLLVPPMLTVVVLPPWNGFSLSLIAPSCFAEKK